MAAQWRIRVRGKQREPVNVDLVVQAVIALGRQLWDEEQPSVRANETGCASADPEVTGEREEGES